jgi:Neuraminidase (sialidase)
MTFDDCMTADRRGRAQKAAERTAIREGRKCDPLNAPPPFAYTDSPTVNAVAVDGAKALTHKIFGGPPVLDAGLFTKIDNKEAARCQLEMLKRADKLENRVLKEVIKAKKKALKDEAANSSAALEAKLQAVLSSNKKISRVQDGLVKGVDRKCAALQVAPGTLFPGDCGEGDPDLRQVEACVIAAARCEACLKINAFDDLNLDCDQAADQIASTSGADFVAQVTTDAQGTWVAVWHSLNSLGGAIGTDRDILVARSTDGGVTWTAPAALNTNAATDSGQDRRAQVTTDGLGAWVAVWGSDDSLGDTIGTDYDILVARSTDNGATWTAPTALNTNAATDSGDDHRWPQVTTDRLGNWVAAWHSEDSLEGTVGTDDDIFFSRSSDAGATWTAPAALNNNAATDSEYDGKPQVTTDGAGNWVVAWESYFSPDTDADIFFSRSSDAGATWTAAAALNTNAGTDSRHDFVVQVTTDGAGNWVAVWDSQDSLGDTIGLEHDILVSRSTNAGATWTAPVPLNTNAATDSGGDHTPQLTTDGAENWVAVWESYDSLEGTIGTDGDILLARSTNAGTTWTAPAALNTNAGSDAGRDLFAQVTTDGQGTWVAVWQSLDSLGGTIGTDWDILVARSTDGGATWTAPVALNTNAGSDASWVCPESG